MAGDVRFETHPPERRRRSTVLLAHGCCCCCIHSLGGLAGAIFGSIRRKAPSPESLTTEAMVREEGEIRTSSRYAAKVYWLALTLVAVFTIAGFTFGGKDVVIGPVVVVFFLPTAQLAAAIFSAIYIRIRPPARASVCFRRLLAIVIWGFLGALGGCVGTILSFYV